VLGEPEEAARLVLARAVKQVLANGLTLLGINAPERM
jgi:arginyl-tRNA synthetase